MIHHRLLATVAIAAGSAAAVAKLPPPSEEAKAKAAETAAKTAWTDKVSSYQLCKAQDRLAAAYLANARKAGQNVQPVATPPCHDPGPFAYTPPKDKPLEASGAHSPPGAAISPPSAGTPAPTHDETTKKK